MKKYLVALTLVLATAPAFAGEIVAKVSHIDMTVASIGLTKSNVLVVELMNGKTLREKVAGSNAIELNELTSDLQDVKLETTHHPVICMIVLNPDFATTLSVADASGELREIESPKSCAISNETMPADPAQAKDADDLADKLILLGRQLANDGL
jgi:hypothetical protein